jgi:DNA-binding MarR family transcriptional regulator
MAKDVPVRIDSAFEREYPGADARAVACIVNLFRAHDLLDGHMRRWLRRYGISVGGFAILVALHDAPEPLPPKALAERLLVTRGSITSLLDSLEKQGLIRRLPHHDDRRMLLIEMTESGHHLFRQLGPLVYLERDWLACLAVEEKEALIGLLGKIQKHLAPFVPTLDAESEGARSEPP